MERRTGKIRGAFSRMHRALDGCMLARAPASPTQGLHHHGPRYFNFGETTQQGAPRSFCDTTGYSFLSSWNERS